MFKVKNIDSEKGNLLHKFIESVMTLHLDVIEDKNVLTINRKYHKIRKAYGNDEVDYDSVDEIIDQITKAKNKLESFTKEATEIDERFKAVGKQLFELIFKVIRDSIEDQVDFTQVLSALINTILSRLFKESIQLSNILNVSFFSFLALLSFVSSKLSSKFIVSALGVGSFNE